MFIAKVVANIVSTQKSQKMIGQKLLIVQPLDAMGIPYAQELTAVDAVGAGIGDIVVALCEGAAAREIAGLPKNAAAEVAIAGIIDYVDTCYGLLTCDGVLHEN